MLLLHPTLMLPYQLYITIIMDVNGHMLNRVVHYPESKR